MKDAQSLKFSQMRGGKIHTAILTTLSVVLLGLSVLVLDRLSDFVYLLLLLV